MKVLKKNKGFTLVELIVVIAIIGILAAVLIPSITGFIDKARISNDTVDAKNMNTLLETYLFENNIDGTVLDAEDVRFIISVQDSQYDFVPSYKKGVYYYNQSASKIEYSSSGIDGLSLFAAGGYSSIEDISGSGKLYLNTKGEVADFLKKLRNVVNSESYTALAAQATDLKLQGLYQEFNPETTLFINSDTLFSNAGVNDVIQKVVFASNIFVLSNPLANQTYQFAPNTEIKLPLSVVFVNENAFNYVASPIKVNSKSRLTKFLDGSINELVTSKSKTVDPTSYRTSLSANNSLIEFYEDGEKVPSHKISLVENDSYAYTSVKVNVTYSDLEINVEKLIDVYPTIKRAQINYEGENGYKKITVLAFNEDGIIAYLTVLAPSGVPKYNVKVVAVLWQDGNKIQYNSYSNYKQGISYEFEIGTEIYITPIVGGFTYIDNPWGGKFGFAKTYQFDGWYTDENLTNGVGDGFNVDPDTNVISFKVGEYDVTLYANFVVVGDQYQFSYELNGGTNTSRNPKASKFTSINSENGNEKFYSPTKTGYTFEGWYLNPDFSGNAIEYVSQLNGMLQDITLYAKWIQE